MFIKVQAEPVRVAEQVVQVELQHQVVHHHLQRLNKAKAFLPQGQQVLSAVSVQQQLLLKKL
jgi:hypothetical protein